MTFNVVKLMFIAFLKFHVRLSKSHCATSINIKTLVEELHCELPYIMCLITAVIVGCQCNTMV